MEKRPNPADAAVPRITWKTLSDQLLGFFALESGLLRTIRDLFLRPGPTVRRYLFTPERGRYSNPVGFALLTAAVIVFMLSQFHTLDHLLQDDVKLGMDAAEQVSGAEEGDAEQLLKDEETKRMVRERLEQYYNVLVMIQIPFISLLSLLLFRRSGLNYPEHLAANTFLSGVQNVLYLPFIPFLSHMTLLAIIYLCISLLYQFYFYFSLFEGRFRDKLWRSALTIILGMAFYALFVSGLMVLLFVFRA